MTSTENVPARSPGAVKAYIASLTGTSLEYYDFALYSVASAVVFPSVFFPSGDPYIGLILSFSTFAVGYFARPIGGIVFGRLGDKIGRKNVLVATLLLIGGATVLIGLLPSHATLGITASALLVLLRFAQGIGVGGEWGGAVLLSSEFADPRSRGLWASAAQIGVPVGNLMANGVLAGLAAVLTDESFRSWGWRIGFLASAILVAFGLMIRLRLEETPVFQALQEREEPPAAPVIEVLKTHPRALLAAAFSRLCPDVLYSLLTVFLATYATKQLGYATSEVLTAVMIGSATQIVVMPFSGWLTDRVNRRWVYGIGALATAVWVPILFVLIGNDSRILLTLSIVVGMILHALMYGPQAAFITEQFPARLRYSGSSLAYTFAGVAGGAMAPLLFTMLFKNTGTWVSIAVYVAVSAALTIAGMMLGRDPDTDEDLELLSAAPKPAAQ
ncbi:MFS transporter [Tsukamurella sp. 1534]|uniref:MFS transporter n=1 Tax=Tsukamurella sp. 1534 TaxID=1151061 RepID=UPI0002FDBE25|nr:MFS transporter [Tsukamurella sp. 1534]